MKLLHTQRKELIPWLSRLQSDCAACSGLCCRALYCFKSDGFPKDKPAGIPCMYLQSDSRCQIHDQLLSKKLFGCIHYDCLGAGQHSLKLFPSFINETEQFAVFQKMIQYHQMLSYLVEAASLHPADSLLPDIYHLLQLFDAQTDTYEHLHASDIEAFRSQTNAILKKALQKTRTWIPQSTQQKKKVNYIGKNFHGQNMSGWDFSMSLLMAANFTNCTMDGICMIGSDVRDAIVKGCDLRNTIYLTQMQLNSMQGDIHTQLPAHLQMPQHWLS